MEMPTALKSMYRSRWNAWLSRRIPPTADITLNQRRIFIFLTRYGGFFALLLLCLFIAGINYANNLLLGMCFLLGSLSVIAIHHTYGNLSGLRVETRGAIPAFAGELAGFTIRLSNPDKRIYYSLSLHWADAVEDIDRIDQSREVTLYLRAGARGRFHPPRLRINTTYPLGLLRAWTWLELDMSAIIYPAPIASEVMPVGEGSTEDAAESRRRRAGQEDFEALRTFVPGDPLAHVSWKHLARGQGMLVKTYSEPVSGSDTLDYAALHGMDRENRLSRLAWWVERLHQQQQPYALKLPGRLIPVSQGTAHRGECLEALALFEEKA
ncbi:MAG TPA: DUF58 domain-containing protein [Fluviicoccus sp.]|nr:DUF58 domain-containing protein [Fluviicoccus sp.]